ncbi:MAG: phosphoribosylformylglycinamidine synthase, partial [Spirochaetaceae bacterium]|nr:phosphoribosylformylglycinamidine synthase [Spirochaetaceae bacterium]
MAVYRVYVEKKADFASAAEDLRAELVRVLGIRGLKKARIAQRYDIEGIDRALFDHVARTVLSEPPVDDVYFDAPSAGFICAVEYLPGQFDQRADSAAECIQLISQAERPVTSNARLYMFDGEITDADKKKIEKYLINPVDSRPACMAERTSLRPRRIEPPDVGTIYGFIGMKKTDAELGRIIESYSLAMDKDDLALCMDYFRSENRDPVITELRVIDTYWSDHCRHTTFNTALDSVTAGDAPDGETHGTYRRYLELRKEIYGERSVPVTLMDIATIGAKYLSLSGRLKDWDRSDENNACSIKIKADNGGKEEDWLLLFKNETHNHPTEIEPFGGAATCIGGAIRDPLSGRAYVYQAMRVTGAGNPLAPAEAALEGKLPQRRLVTEAARGYSSYGNQVGIATGLVEEFYHEGYAAKRMEIGAAIGAVPAEKVRRERPRSGDTVIVVGGRTGRDGCGGATGSSKPHSKESLESCGAEVQKGNAPVERHLQRLFRNPSAALMIKRCNDFGAGGVAVAIGELAAGLSIDLDALPVKYAGLDGTELAISESQERMAVVTDEKDAAAFISLAAAENLEAVVTARVTDENRLVMRWRGKKIVDISRDFLNTNGAEKHARARTPRFEAPLPSRPAERNFEKRLTELVSDLNSCCKRGLFERFDSTIGAGTALAPAGGVFQLTPAQCMAAKLPVEGGTYTCAGMAFGFDPYISAANPYEGAYLAVLESVAKLVAAGFPLDSVYLSFQEYFPRPGNDAERWGLPVAALLGALQAQLDLGAAAIGGKDSMSGTFENLDVPPSLVSFAVAHGHAGGVIGGEFKKAGHEVLWVRPASRSAKRGSRLFKPEAFNAALRLIEKLVAEKKAVSVYVALRGGAAEALFKMACGNRIGVAFKGLADEDALFEYKAGSFIAELNDGITAQDIESGHESVVAETLGKTSPDYAFVIGEQTVDLKRVQRAWESKLESVFPVSDGNAEKEVPCLDYRAKMPARAGTPVARPRALIPVFPGTNCEYDTARALRAAGAEAEIFVVRNLNPAMVAESAAFFAKRIDAANMLVIPGGFSGGDEPDGSAKLIAAFFRGGPAADAITRLLDARDGLILGICNGFQALIKLGLVPFGKIKNMEAGDPALAFNTIGRHQSRLV